MTYTHAKGQGQM